jgi:hypothetical protein
LYIAKLYPRVSTIITITDAKMPSRGKLLIYV